MLEHIFKPHGLGRSPEILNAGTDLKHEVERTRRCRWESFLLRGETLPGSSPWVATVYVGGD